MSTVYHNRLCKLLIPPHFKTESQDMFHGIIGYDLIEMESQLDWNNGTL